MLEAFLESVLPELTEWKTVLVVTDVLKTVVVSGEGFTIRKTYTELKWFSLKISSIKR
jgi:hypothetical protein